MIFLIIGAAMDFSLKPDGSVDVSLLGNGLNRVMNNPALIFSALFAENSYAPKMIFLEI